MRKRLCSLFLALMMVLGLLPTTALAAGEDSITAYVTISKAGTLVTGKDGTPVGCAPVTVTDQNQSGTFDIDDVLYAAHAQYYSAGAAGYGSSDGYYGLSLNKLWGDTSFNFGYLLDNQYPSDLTAEVAPGSHVTAYIYQDTTYYSDCYSNFDKTRAVTAVNRGLDLTLYYDFDVPAAGIPVIISGSDQELTTDASGKVTLSFGSAGTYVVSAEGTVRGTVVTDWSTGTTAEMDRPLIPPACRVEVLSAADYAAYEVLEQAADMLTWDILSQEAPDALTTGPVLPASLTVNDKTVEVSWACDDPTHALSVSYYEGYGYSAYVSRPLAQDAASTLTATLRYGDQTLVKNFSVAVKAEGVTEEKESVVSYASLMNGIAGTYTTSTDAWTVLDMAAYGSDIKGDSYGYSSAAPIALAEAALGRTPDLDALSSFDVNGDFAIYSTPYVLLAYDAAEADDSGFATKRDDLKSSLTTYLNSLSGNYADTDEVTPILAALAPYYQQGDPAVVPAVDAAVTWLSNRQNADGTFSYYGTKNSNSTALAVVALAALGIDAHRDPRFVKEQSALDGLFSFSVETLDGLGYQGNVTTNALATEQGFRALVAYARFAETGSAYNIYLDADVNAEAPAAPQITATVPSRPEDPDGGSTPSTGEITVSIRVADPQGRTYLDKTTYTMDSGATAYDLLVETGLDIRSTETQYGTYVQAIEGLGEFSQGSESGWMYRVNGVYPQVSADSKVLKNGDYVEWLYTRELGSDIGGGYSGAAVSTDRKAAAGADALIAAIGTVTKDSGAAIEAARQAYDALTAAQKKLVEGYDALLAAESAYARLSAPLPFTDVAEDYWAREAIWYVYGLGLMNGTSGTVFSPETAVSRGMIVTILYRLEGTPTAAGNAGFNDVTADMYCADAVRWAALNGIITGYGDGSFGPGHPVTREQLAVILYRYAAFKGQDVTAGADLSRFADADSIGAPFLDSLKWANAEGLINGTAANALAPQGRASRAQAAVILMRYLENTGK